MYTLHEVYIVGTRSLPSSVRKRGTRKRLNEVVVIETLAASWIFRASMVKVLFVPEFSCRTYVTDTNNTQITCPHDYELLFLG